MKRVGVVLAGCGVYDGAEIYESVFTLLALEKAGVEAVCMAPNRPQYHVINHLTGQEEPGEERNVLIESARVARGQIEDIAGVESDDLDALVFVGGFGAAKNLSTFAIDGPKASLDDDVRRLVEDVSGDRKPIGFICISPAIGAQVLGGSGVELTIGNDSATADGIESFGARHVACGVTDIHADPERRVISTPAYMLGQSMADVQTGIDKLVNTLLAWIS